MRSPLAWRFLALCLRAWFHGDVDAKEAERRLDSVNGTIENWGNINDLTGIQVKELLKMRENTNF